MSHQRRVLMTIAELGIGGAERLLVELATAFAERGDLVAAAAAPGPLAADLEAAGIRWSMLPPPSRGVATTLATVRRLGGLTRAGRPDLIHAHNVRIAAASALGARAARPRPQVLVTFHGVTPPEYGAAARALRLADRIVCVSRSTADQIIEAGVPAARTEVIVNAVPDAPPLSPARRDELDREFALGNAPAIAIVGRLVEQKRHDRFLEAAGLVLERIPDAVFLVVGDGSLRESLERLTADLGLADHVRFAGARQDARDLIARADLLVFSSDWEGLSLVALEALAAGTPVVSTDVQGMREALGEDAGIIVPEPSAGALAVAIVSLLAAPSARERMGDAGRARHRDRYSMAAMIDAYAAAYDRLLTP